MNRSGGSTIFRDFRRLFEAGTAAGVADGQLLERFVDRRDEDAFEALVARHGPMILGVCRHLLHDANDVEDAFQATLLILGCKAGSVRAIDSLAPWLYGVAVRVATRCRAKAAKRSARERRGNEAAIAVPERDGDQDDLRLVIHEELNLLPERFRTPIVLCYIEGLTHEQAAERLRCPVGTIRSRLARGRARLRACLGRRGLDASSCLTAVVPCLLPVPDALLESSFKSAALFVAGQRVAESVSPEVAQLMKGTLMSMLMSKLRVGAAAVIAAGVITAGASVLAYQSQGENRPRNVPEGSATTDQAEIKGKTSGPARTVFGSYYVGDILYRTKYQPEPGAGASRTIALMPAIDLITSTVAPGTWKIIDDDGRDLPRKGRGYSSSPDQAIGAVTGPRSRSKSATPKRCTNRSPSYYAAAARPIYRLSYATRLPPPQFQPGRPAKVR